jgi:predicted nucleotidyltransferase component of viral defense system
LSLLIIERDYIQSYILAGIASRPALKDRLIFKGGTALKKVHFREYRFSEDLDFSAIDAPTGLALEDELERAISTARAMAGQHADIELALEPYVQREAHPGGQQAFTVRIQYPWHPRPMVNIKLEITHDEPVLVTPLVLPVVHAYDEPLEVAITLYALEEICAEKLRATRQTLAKLEKKGWARSRGRDYYDLWHLTKLPSNRMDWSTVRSVLAAKCAHREVKIDSIADVFDERLLERVRGEWRRTVGPFMRELPDVDKVLKETRDALERALAL